MLNSVKTFMLSGKRSHFAFVVGLGYGYLQYRFLEDLFTARANMFDRSSEVISKLLTEVFHSIHSLGFSNYEDTA